MSFSVTASSGTTLSYQWLKNGSNIYGATLSSFTITNVQASDQGVYAVTVVNAGGSVTSSNATLTVLVPPTITMQPQSQAVNKNDTISFSVTASGTAPLGYQWSLSGAALAGATNSTLTIYTVHSGDTGNYSVVVTNYAGSVTSAVAVLTMNAPPYILTQPQSQAVILGQNASFSVVAIGLAPVTYQWSFNGTNLSNATNSTLTLISVNTNNAGSYQVVLANNQGSVTSSNATLTVLSPPVITTQPQSQAVTSGNPVSFSVVPGGAAPFTYQWYLNGSSLGGGNGAQTATYSLNSVGTGNAGNYTVVITNSYGSVTSVVATLTVYVAPTITAQPANRTVTQGQNATFSVTVSSSSTQPVSYQWNVNGVNPPWATNSSLTITNAQATDAGSYFVVITNLGGSVTSSTKTLTVNVPAGIATQPQSVATNNGNNVTFTVVPSGTPNFNYQWYFNGTAVTNTASLSLNNVQPGNAGSYTVVVNNNWGMVTSTPAILTVYVPPTFAPQPGNQTVVQGGTATFTSGANGTSPFSYQWYFNGTNLTDGPNISGSLTNLLTLANCSSNTAGNYTVVVTNLGGSATSHVATLTVNIPAFITSQPTSLIVTQGQAAAFSVGAGGTATIKYQWYLNGVSLGNSSGGQTAALALSSAGTNNAGSYTVVAYNNYGSVTSSVVNLTVLVPAQIATQPASQTTTLGQTVSLAVGAFGDAPLSYQWSFNGSNTFDGPNLSGSISNVLTLANIQTNQAGNYAVTVVNNWGSVVSSNATLTVYLPTVITNQPQSIAVTNGNSASFSVGATGSGTLTYQWYANGTSVGGGSGGQTATFTIGNVGTSTATNYYVVVTGSGGSITSAVATLTVYVPPSISSQPSGASAVQFQSVTFSVTGSGSPTPAYQWNLNGTNLVDGPYITYYAGATNVTYVSGSATATLTISNVQPAQAGNVFVTLTNFGGSLSSQTRTLTVYVPATITNQPQSQAVVASGTANFSVGTVGTATVKYQWYFNSASLGSSSGGQTATYTASSVGANNVGNYFVVVNNSYGTVTSAVVSLTALLAQPTNQTAGVGQSASFSVGVGSPVPVGYQWTFNGANLPGATNATLTLPNIQTNQAGNYAAVITSPGGVLTSAPATLTVLPIWAYMVVNTSPSGPGSLQQAILNANANSGLCTIVFQIPGSGPWTISPTNLLPVVTNPIMIDATTQPGFSSTNQPIVQVDGGSLPNGTVGDGLVITASGCTVRGLDISSFPGNGLTLSNCSGSVIQGNFIGCALNGISTAPNSGNGIMIFNSASNVIGGTTALTRNVVVKSGNDGIHLEGAGSSGNQIVGNIVGIDSTGQAKVLGVGGSAIVLNNALGNLIGGTNTGSGNVCASGTSGSGLVISGTSAAFNLVQGNFIGTDITGTNKSGCVTGISILNASSNTIGGLTIAAGNVIGFNTGNGIAISGLTAQFNQIQGNFIGTDRTATFNLKNSSAGVYSTTAINNTVGGLAAGAGNIIANNGSPGVIVSGGQCAILVNSLYGNGNGGDISLINSGNLTAVSPALTAVTNNTLTTEVVGVLTNYPNNTYRIEFYASPNLSDANTFLGASNVVTSSSGIATFNVLLNTGNLTNQYITATATDTGGNTSQISLSKAVNFYGFPAITSNPQSLTGITGSATNLTVAATGVPAPAYQWYLNGNALPNATNATLAFSPLSTNNAGSYTVVVSNSIAAVMSVPAIVTVLVPAGITSQPVSQTAVRGLNIVFTVAASGTAPFGYQWTFNGTNLVGATNAALSLTSVSTNNAGTYAVVVTNVAGLVVSSNATLTVINPVANLSVGSSSGMTASGFVFDLSVTLGSTYVVLTSTNLQNWIPLTTNVAVSTNVVITDATATNFSWRFYQVIVQ